MNFNVKLLKEGIKRVIL
ncbi:MAG: hypothetical protein MZV64_53340 [Ignavibacteriales bacterium]|nr:hypothetical protein [Ignavibacteriales bacterium]